MKNISRTLTILSLCALLGALPLFAQTVKLTGKVTDKEKNPLPGVTITVLETSKTVNTDLNGNYSVEAKKGAKVKFEFPGYKSQTHVIKNLTLNVKLEPDIVEVSEVLHIAKQNAEYEDMVFSAEDAAPRAQYERQSSRVTQTAVMGYAAHKQVIPNAYYPGGEEYSGIKENRFNSALNTPLSTFALEVDGASYSNVRRMINAGQFPSADAVRVEEFINYFSYDYPEPTGKDPVRITTEVGACPWNTRHKLVSIGIKAKQIPSDDLPASNFVFLIDVSGSMWGRLDMVKSSMKLLVNNMRPTDKVSIVTYASGVALKLPATPGDQKQKIRESLDALTAGGGTAGARGIQLAYETARKNFIKGGNNRVILCTDGDINVGASSPAELEKLIDNERKSGVFLTVLGYGMGNYKDNRMQTLAEKGNGNYAYIDNMQEANKVLVNEFGGTMYTVAKDVKLQVEFNPATVQSYRLVGYESRLLRDEDFNDDTVDAGEIGAGHTVTALYEVVPVGVEGAPGVVDPLKYQPEKNSPKYTIGKSSELMTVKLRYKDPDGDKSKLIDGVVKGNNSRSNTTDFKFAASAAMFGQLLRDSDFKGDASYKTAADFARAGAGEDPYGYRLEMMRLALAAEGLAK